MNQPELDPVAIRKALVKHREKGSPWDVAWPDATNHHTVNVDERGLYAFMEKNFRAAYFNTSSSLGRCRVDERDVSAAIGAATRLAPTPTHEFCRSGDGCDRPAVWGRFGRTFCEHHAAELSHIAEKFKMDRHLADPRAGGNNAIFGRRKAA